MKGLMAKFKGLQIKQLMIGHGEKFVLGTVGLIVILALTSTQWSGYENRPDDLFEKAATAGTKLNTGEWPVEKANAFQPSTYQTTAQEMFVKMNNPEIMSPFGYDKPMSFPLYARQEPRGETIWPPVQHLIADADVMVLAVAPAQEFGAEMEGAEEGEEEETRGRPPRVPAAGGLGATPAGGPGAAPPALMGEMMMKGMQGGMMGGNSTGMQPRGQRYVAVRGIVSTLEIGRAIQKACHLESLSDGIAAVEIRDFKIQRQKAVAGDNPWPENTWQDVSLEPADQVLEECGQAADLVAAGATDPVFTMPLPSRLDGDYSERIVSHPILKDFQLTPEQRKWEQELNSAFLTKADELGLQEQVTKRRGFLKNQVDINSVRSSVMGSGADMSDIMKKMSSAAPGAMGAGAGGRGGAMSTLMMPPGQGGGRGGAMPPMMNPMGMGMGGGRGGAMPPGMGGMGMGMGMGGGQGGQQQVGGAAVGYAMLFRFLDFDVNPGEAYRYRVQLEFTNPNFDLSLDKVKEAKVKEGETRLSDWSEPTAPVVVKPDTNFYLSKVDKRPRTRGEAEFQIFQWDPALGTYIDSKKLVAKYGQFVGGLEESDRLDLGAPALEKKTVLFATKDFLLDTALPPTLIPAENPDLNLAVSGRQAKEGLDLPAEAAVLDEYGQLRTLDSVSERAAVDKEDQKVKKEREPYESLRDTGAADTNKLNQLDGDPAANAGMMMQMQMGMGGPSSNLKRGGKAGGASSKNKRGGAGGYPMMDPTGGANSKKKAGR